VIETNSLMVYQEYVDVWADQNRRSSSLSAFALGEHSFVPGLLPEHLLKLNAREILALLRNRFGETVDLAVAPEQTDPEISSGKLPLQIRGPVVHQPDGTWLKRSNTVGINIRTLGSFWDMVKYALSLPAVQDSIHILPIWEPGVAGSMYGISSWNLNPEFYSEELVQAIPHLNTLDRQLRGVVNLLHVMGKSVGMDVIPHTDRFSEIVLAYPEYFEWLQRQDAAIIDHRANLHVKVQKRLVEFLQVHGPALSSEKLPPNLYDSSIDEFQRMRVLFGLSGDYEGRNRRRNLLIQHLYRYGYEPVPATMAPPYRGLAVDTRPEAMTVDAHGQVWRDFVITRPEPMSRVFGPLTRYKLYESKDDNANWELDFDRPRPEVWEYVCQKYDGMQQRFGFDFMRGDMSHVQMRPAGVPQKLNRYYDILGSVKTYIQSQGISYFGYFAETFLPPRDVMGYGEEMDHLEASNADVTLGDLQSTIVGSEEFLQRFRQYLDYLETRDCAPCFTVMTADKDDPRFDEYYRAGNEARLFISYFLTAMPGYMGLGFETRDIHLATAPNEHYTKLFVFQQTTGSKATRGPYCWGKNGYLFSSINRMRLYADSIWKTINNRPVRWLLPPDAVGKNKIISWTQANNPEFVFVVNTDTAQPIGNFGIPASHIRTGQGFLVAEFTTLSQGIQEQDRKLAFNGNHYWINQLAPGECRVYRVSTK